jgi:hypothetical protein
MNIIEKIANMPVGLALIWSLAANVVLASLLLLSIIRYPLDGADVPAKAAQLYQHQIEERN